MSRACHAGVLTTTARRWRSMKLLLLLVALVGLAIMPTTRAKSGGASAGGQKQRAGGRPSKKRAGGRPPKDENSLAPRCIVDECHQAVTCDECSVCSTHAFDFGNCTECKKATKCSRHDDGGASPAHTRKDGAHAVGSLAEALTPPAMYFTPSDGMAQSHRPLSDPEARLTDLKKAFGHPGWSKLPDPQRFVATLPAVAEGDESSADENDDNNDEDSLGA